MATRQLLAELTDVYRERNGIDAEFKSVGGVDAARRVKAGEPFDVVVLAADAIDQLIDDGCVVVGSRTDLVRSSVAVAVRKGRRRPEVGSEDALRRSVLAARKIGYSTGPSGVALIKLFERWGIAEALADRLVQAPAGVPVGALLARDEVELGFQQLSELKELPDVDLAGPMPPGVEIVTTFAGGLCTASTQPTAVRALLDFMRSPAAAEAKLRNGMEPA